MEPREVNAASLLWLIYLTTSINKIKFDTDCYEGQLSKQLHPSEKIGTCNQTPLLTGLKNTLKYYLQEKYQIKIWTLLLKQQDRWSGYYSDL